MKYFTFTVSLTAFSLQLSVFRFYVFCDVRLSTLECNSPYIHVLAKMLKY